MSIAFEGTPSRQEIAEVRRSICQLARLVQRIKTAIAAHDAAFDRLVERTRKGGAA